MFPKLWVATHHDLIVGGLLNWQGKYISPMESETELHSWVGKCTSVHFEGLLKGKTRPLEWSWSDERGAEQMLQKSPPQYKGIKTEAWAAANVKFFFKAQKARSVPIECHFKKWIQVLKRLETIVQGIVTKPDYFYTATEAEIKACHVQNISSLNKSVTQCCQF